MNQARFPRISTRGFYDLGTGKTKSKKKYDLFPAKFFENLAKTKEFTIVVHGLRNNKMAALEKFKIAQKKLMSLGYAYPVVGYSYDANVKKVQYARHFSKAAKVGQIIARKNGSNLAKFIIHITQQNPKIKIRLIGHSLGTEVILHALGKLYQKGTVQAVYFFGSSVGLDLLCKKRIWRIIKKTIKTKLVNYYSKDDQVLLQAHSSGMVVKPVGCFGVNNKIPKYKQILVRPKNHRFASYLRTLKSYPKVQ